MTAVILILTGCTSTRHMSSYDAEFGQEDQSLITHSLFDSGESRISEPDIKKILDGRIVLPEKLRIAVYKIAGTSTNRYYSYYWRNEEYLKTQQSFMDTITAKLEESGRVVEVIVVPSLMTAPEPNITQMRESAVRLQADVLMVFSIQSDIYYRYRTFQKNEAKAYATCEAILLDNRTGVIPFSSIITREKLVVKESEDWTNEETRKRAENGAVIATLTETGNRVVDYLTEESE